MDNGTLKGDARPWRVYSSPRKGIRVTRRTIPPPEMRKDEVLLIQLPGDLSHPDAVGMAKAKAESDRLRKEKK